jgi:hypothetical protein
MGKLKNPDAADEEPLRKLHGRIDMIVSDVFHVQQIVIALDRKMDELIILHKLAASEVPKQLAFDLEEITKASPSMLNDWAHMLGMGVSTDDVSAQTMRSLIQEYITRYGQMQKKVEDRPEDVPLPNVGDEVWGKIAGIRYVGKIKKVTPRRVTVLWNDGDKQRYRMADYQKVAHPLTDRKLKKKILREYKRKVGGEE